MPSEKACQILAAGAGSQWDPEIIDVFMSIVDDIERIREDYSRSDPPRRVKNTTRKSG